MARSVRCLKFLSIEKKIEYRAGLQVRPPAVVGNYTGVFDVLRVMKPLDRVAMIRAGFFARR